MLCKLVSTVQVQEARAKQGTCILLTTCQCDISALACELLPHALPMPRLGETAASPRLAKGPTRSQLGTIRTREDLTT
eukprot:1952007-Amphidinium_carterae.1